jgi:hypothetical protein
VAEHKPDVPVVLTSGFAEGASGQLEGAPNARAMLRKPYSRVELATVLNSVLSTKKT